MWNFRQYCIVWYRENENKITQEEERSFLSSMLLLFASALHIDLFVQWPLQV